MTNKTLSSIQTNYDSSGIKQMEANMGPKYHDYDYAKTQIETAEKIKKQSNVVLLEAT